jgi:uncharacterized protein YecT (DUF1311 family)
MLRIAVAAFAFVMLGAAAEAADCANPANQAELTECAGAAANKADADLNEAYGKLMPLLDSADQVRLLDAQRAWIGFRDAECAFRTKSYEDGSIYSTLIANCIADLSAARAAQLMDQVNCGEGDLCPPHVAAPVEEAPVADVNDSRSCRITSGMKRAQLYASQCSAVGPDNEHCNFETACGVMIDDIKTGCIAAGTSAPGFCAAYLGKAKGKP